MPVMELMKFGNTPSCLLFSLLFPTEESLGISTRKSSVQETFVFLTTIYESRCAICRWVLGG